MWKVQRVKTGEFLAAKFEESTRVKELAWLNWEARVLHKLKDTAQVPKLHFIGVESSTKSHIMLMTLLGPSLEELFEKCKYRFDLKTVLLIGVNLIKIIEKVHGQGIIHRDLKPQNLLLGGTEITQDTIYMVDFGLAKVYRTNNEHIPYKQGKGMVGTVRYASLATHRGVEQSRRDDMEAIGYMMVYFLRGSLPW